MQIEHDRILPPLANLGVIVVRDVKGQGEGGGRRLRAAAAAAAGEEGGTEVAEEGRLFGGGGRNVVEVEA